MAVTGGARLGPYEILSLLGAGGMGEVYKARDTRLDRIVAIKVLPTALSADATRRARFAREAKAISALSHPHICSLYDVGEEHDILFLVLEYLDGETLAARLRRGPLAIAQALDVAMQVAEGLAAAHKRRTIHRDLKPGNVMLTKTGVKLLDFGLAKFQIETDRSAPTQTELLTGSAAIVGTLPYMAPEQLEDADVDARTDLFALGTIVYEMVSGRRPFEGDSAASLRNAIATSAPPSLAKQQPLTPPVLDRLVQRLLAKNPDDRWDSAHDVADELRWISQTATASIASPSAQHARRLTMMRAVALALVASAAGVAVSWRLRPVSSPHPVVRSLLDVKPAEQLNAGGATFPLGTSDFGWSRPPSWLPTPGGSRTALTWTPDGGALVFVGWHDGVQQLYVRALDRIDAQPLAGTNDAQVPVVSPDGAWLAFWSRGAIWKVSLAGGLPVIVCDGPNTAPVGMSWSASRGLVYAKYGAGTLWQVSNAGGKPIELTTRLPNEYQHVLPYVLPNDAAVLYTVRRYDDIWSDDDLVAQSLTTGARKMVLHDAVDARYVSSGHLVFLRQGTLMAVPFDLSRLEVRGSPVPLVDHVAQSLIGSVGADVTGAGQFSVASTGALAYVAGQEVLQPDRDLVTIDRHGTATPLSADAHSHGPYDPRIRLSPDGARLLLNVRSLTEKSICVYDFARGTLTKLTNDGDPYVFEWTRDGQRVVYDRNIAGKDQLVWQRADGVGVPEVLVNGQFTASSWSKDGRELFVQKDDDIWVLSVDTSPPTLRPVVQSPGEQSGAALSPDGRALAYDSTESGRWEVYIRPFPRLDQKIQVSVDGGNNVMWNPRGGEIFYVTRPSPGGSDRMMVVDVRTSPELKVGRPRFLFESPVGGINHYGIPRLHDIAPDGEHFLAATSSRVGAPPPPVTQIHLVLHWLDEVKPRVPAGG